MFLQAGSAHSSNEHTRRNASPTTDLHVLESNARQDLAPRTLPNGKLYCAELSKSEKLQDGCVGDLEDTLLASETDKEVGLANLSKGIQRIRNSINPCPFWNLACKSRAKKLDREQTP